MRATEHEASNLWCPMARVTNGTQITNTTINRSWNQNGNAPDIFCLGSRCAMWRWADPLRRRFTIPDEIPDEIPGDDAEPARPPLIPATWAWTPGDDAEPSGWLEPEDEAQARRHGFCGLAGKPGF